MFKISMCKKENFKQAIQKTAELKNLMYDPKLQKILRIFIKQLTIFKNVKLKKKGRDIPPTNYSANHHIKIILVSLTDL